MNYLIDPISSIAGADGARPFIVLPNTVLRYGEIERRIAFACHQLQRNGLGPGNAIALYHTGGAPDPDVVLRKVILILAAIRLGIIVAPLGRHLPANAILSLLEQLGGATLVGADGLSTHELTDGELESANLYTWLLDREATIVFTSGSTGAPKAVVHTLGNHYWSAKGWTECFPVTMTDRWLLNLPLNHVGGLAVLFRAVFAGASIAIPAPDKSLSEALYATGSTIASAVPTQLVRALKEQDKSPPPALRKLLLGGSAISPKLVATALEHGWPIWTSYGMTEMTSTIAAAQLSDQRKETDIVEVLPNRKVAITDDREIMLWGSVRFSGYRDRMNLEQPFNEDTWFSSGDLGEWITINHRQYLRFLGRKDNRFVSGGENIQPEAIEQLLLAQEGIRRTLVVPVPNEEFGERPVAFVDSESWEPEVWKQSIRQTLPSFFVPDAFLEWPRDESDIDKPNRKHFARLAVDNLSF